MDAKYLQTAVLIFVLSTVSMGQIPSFPKDGKDVCDVYDPSDCPILDNIQVNTLRTVEEFDYCAPALLSPETVNYYLAASGRRVTYNRNLNIYKQFTINPRMLRDVSDADTSTTVLGEPISFPAGLAPAAQMKLADLEGEIAAVRAAVKQRTVMIVSSLASVAIEDIAAAADQTADGNAEPVLWMQTYIFKNRQETISVVRRAEKAGCKAIVVTVDTPVWGSSPCNPDAVLDYARFPNLFNETFSTEKIDPSVTFEDVEWLVRNTVLPVVAKGILTGDDAVQAAKSGAAAILVSNHGGRRQDSAPTTFEVLPEVVEALKSCCPSVEVYLDSGVRNGWDVYKAIARGARAVFIGRPTLWGLAVGGEAGVRRVLSILRNEFNDTMMLSGFARPSEIEDTLRPRPFIRQSEPAERVNLPAFGPSKNKASSSRHYDWKKFDSNFEF